MMTEHNDAEDVSLPVDSADKTMEIQRLPGYSTRERNIHTQHTQWP